MKLKFLVENLILLEIDLITPSSLTERSIGKNKNKGEIKIENIVRLKSVRLGKFGSVKFIILPIKISIVRQMENTRIAKKDIYKDLREFLRVVLIIIL